MPYITHNPYLGWAIDWEKQQATEISYVYEDDHEIK